MADSIGHVTREHHDYGVRAWKKDDDHHGKAHGHHKDDDDDDDDKKSIFTSQALANNQAMNPNSVKLPDTIFKLQGSGTSSPRVQPLIPPTQVQSEAPAATFGNAAQFPPTTFPAGVPVSIPSEADVANAINRIFMG